MEIIKQALSPVKDGTIRIIHKSKEGKQTAFNVNLDEPFGESIRELFNQYSVFAKVGGINSAAKRNK